MPSIHRIIVVLMLIVSSRKLSLLPRRVRARRSRTFTPCIIIRRRFPRQCLAPCLCCFLCTFPISFPFGLYTFAHGDTALFETLAATGRAAAEDSSLRKGEEHQATEVGVFGFEFIDAVFELGEVRGLCRNAAVRKVVFFGGNSTPTLRARNALWTSLALLLNHQRSRSRRDGTARRLTETVEDFHSSCDLYFPLVIPRYAQVSPCHV